MRTTNILTVSVPPRYIQAIERLRKRTDQTKSELVRDALRSYLIEQEEDRRRFLGAYKATRKESLKDLQKLKKELCL